MTISEMTASSTGSANEDGEMGVDLQTRYESRVRVAKAMAHPTRMFIVDELARAGQRCVCELTDLIGDDISTVSKHLAVLKQAGIVVDEKRGNQVYYRLRTPCILDFFRCVESVVESSTERTPKCSCGSCS
jgi:ArsR family transcriptional regulator